MTVSGRPILIVQTSDGQHTFGEFHRWDPPNESHWSLPEKVLLDILSSRICCSGEIAGRVSLIEEPETRRTNYGPFSVDLTFRETLCCGDISVGTFHLLKDRVKEGAVKAFHDMGPRGQYMGAKHFHFGDAPGDPLSRASAEEFSRPEDMANRSNDPTTSHTASSNSRHPRRQGILPHSPYHSQLEMREQQHYGTVGRSCPTKIAWTAR